MSLSIYGYVGCHEGLTQTGTMFGGCSLARGRSVYSLIFHKFVFFFPRAASRRSQFYRQMYGKLKNDLVDLAREYSRLSFAPAITSAIQGQKFYNDNVNLPTLK